VSGVRDLYRAHDDHVTVQVHVHPGAGRTAVVGRHGDALKVKVAAPPTEGRANDAVVQLLADTLGVKAAAVSVVSGATSRSKRIRVDGVEADAVEDALERALEQAGNARPGSRR
jgi:uncharacterized protein (TIGR00251 family)